MYLTISNLFRFFPGTMIQNSVRSRMVFASVLDVICWEVLNPYQLPDYDRVKLRKHVVD